MNTLSEMLTYRRPHGSIGELQFIEHYIAPVSHAIRNDEGEAMMFIAHVRRPDGKPVTTAFCAHTDSVHNRSRLEARQIPQYDPVMQHYLTPAPTKDIPRQDCLGADDAAGCWLLLEMMEAKVPGQYCFFRGEERGGIGSSWIAENRAVLFNDITHAIQFDRKGTKSIITKMMVGRTSSDAFAWDIAERLGMGHEPDPTGSFTDTANLCRIVPECTNISVGYENEHSDREWLDAGYLYKLRDACIKAFSTTEYLVAERDPKAMSEELSIDTLAEASYEEILDYTLYADPNEVADLLWELSKMLEPTVTPIVDLWDKKVPRFHY